MADVILISAPMVLSKEGPAVGDEFTNPWLGVLYIASYLRMNEVTVKVIDPGPERLLLPGILKKIGKEKPKVGGYPP